MIKFINNIPYLKTLNNELIMFWARSFWSPYFKKLNSTHYCSLIKARVSELDSTDFFNTHKLQTVIKSTRRNKMTSLYKKLGWHFITPVLWVQRFNSLKNLQQTYHHLCWSYIKGEHFQFSRLPLSFKVQEKLYSLKTWFGISPSIVRDM